MNPRHIAFAAFVFPFLAGPVAADGQPSTGLPVPGTVWGTQPLVSTTTAVTTNVAAGIANSAVQRPVTVQSGQPTVALDFTGRRPMVTSNVGISTNVTAGLDNNALQVPAYTRR